MLLFRINDTFWMTVYIKPPFRINPTDVMFRSLAKVTASVVGADLDKMTPTPIFAALIKISDEIRPLKINTLSRTVICR